MALSIIAGLMGAHATARIRRRSLVLFAIGSLCLAISAGLPILRQSIPGSIAVMVDLSPSTRGATFRDPVALNRRILQLLGSHPYQLLGFSDRNQSIDLKAPLHDLECDQTCFTPPSVDAVILFSDGRFDLPAAAPPTFPVIDPALDDPADAAVTDLLLAGNRTTALVSGTNRPLHWTGATPDPIAAATRSSVEFATAAGGDVPVIASVDSTDLWPENNSLSILPPPPLQREKWWIGSNCPPGWKALPQLPTDASDYLSASVIALNNMPATDLSSVLQTRLTQYVRDLGGSLVIVGGNNAFAAGAYGGSLLDDLSPLSSNPPGPVMRWLIIADSSGSMAGNPWKTETDVIRGLLAQLPGNDLASIGDFARELRWWWHDTTAGNLAQRDPPDIAPSGPTNLSAMLSQVGLQSDGAIPSQLLLLTDADADLPDPAGITAAFAQKKITLNLLALGHGSALPALRSIAQTTGGTVVEQSDPSRWITAADQLLKSAMPTRYQRTPVDLNPGPGHINEWNQTWAKADAQVSQKAADSPMLAEWRFGSGRVLAIAWPADPASIDQHARSIAVAPVDPRFDVKWKAGSTLSVTIDAMDHGQFLNDQRFAIELRDAQSSALLNRKSISQTAPGQYALSIPAPHLPKLVTVLHDDQMIRQFSIAGRYAPEFDVIGNDRANLSTLAQRTGGKVILPGPVQPLSLQGPIRLVSVASEFAIAGFAGIAAGLIINRKK